MSDRSRIKPPGVYYSPSQITKYRDCNQKWFFATVLKEPEPGTASTAWGTDGHTALEGYLRDKTPPADRRILQAAKNLDRLKIAPEHIEFECKEPFPLLVNEDAVLRWFWGFVDFIDLSGGKHMGRGYDFEIGDHKTMKTMHFAKTDFELAEDFQLNAYAYWVDQKLGLNAKFVRLTHHQIQREGAIESRMPSAVVSMDHVREQWAGALCTILAMERDRIRGQTEVEKNKGACGKYGGCPHRMKCEKFEAPHRGEESLVSIRQKGSKLDELESVKSPTAIEQPPKTITEHAVLSIDQFQDNLPTLYVDCLPLGTVVTTLAEILEPITAAYKKQHGHSWELAQYRQGTGAIASALRTVELPDAIYVPSRSPLGEIAMEVLVPRCNVVKGV